MLASFGRSRRTAAFRRVLWLLAPMVVGGCIYLGLRLAMGGLLDLGGARYGWSSPDGWIVNVARMTAALLSPVNTMTIWDAYHSRDGLTLAAAALLAIGAGLLLFGPAWRGTKRERWLSVVLFGATVGAFFPMAMMRWVSENYVTPALFFYSLLVGFIVHWWVERRREILRRSALGILGVALLVHFWGWQFKVATAAETARRAQRIAERLLGSVADKREGVEGSASRLVCVRDCRAHARVPYSVYRAEMVFKVADALAWSRGAPFRFVAPPCPDGAIGVTLEGVEEHYTLRFTQRSLRPSCREPKGWREDAGPAVEGKAR